MTQLTRGRAQKPRRFVAFLFAIRFWRLVFSASTSTLLLDGRAVRHSYGYVADLLDSAKSSLPVAADRAAEPLFRYFYSAVYPVLMATDALRILKSGAPAFDSYFNVAKNQRTVA